jgi:hypothetical protein
MRWKNDILHFGLIVAAVEPIAESDRKPLSSKHFNQCHRRERVSDRGFGNPSAERGSARFRVR